MASGLGRVLAACVLSSGGVQGDRRIHAAVHWPEYTPIAELSQALVKEYGADTDPFDPAGGPSTGTVKSQPTVYFGSVSLDGNRVGRDAGRIADEVISHLSALPGADVQVTLEIQAKIPGGVDEQTVRVVKENSGALKFTSFGFEEEWVLDAEQ